MPNQAWEHLQNVVRQVHNRRVLEEFDDLEDNDDISTPRSSLRTACKMLDNDTAEMTLIRYFLFYFDLRKAKDMQSDIYGIPVTSFQEHYEFVPQIKLCFTEDPQDVDTGFTPVEGEISFRLAGQTNETITPAIALTLANRTRSAFATGTGFVWKKGRLKVCYRDRARGYDFRLLVTTETEGRRIVEQVLDIQNHTPDWDYLSVAESRASIPVVPPNRQIYGRSRRTRRRRPRADVRFRYAELHIWGLSNPVILVDSTNRFENALVNT